MGVSRRFWDAAGHISGQFWGCPEHYRDNCRGMSAIASAALLRRQAQQQRRNWSDDATCSSRWTYGHSNRKMMFS